MVADIVDRRPDENIIGDIIVVGAGAAGVAAAVTAARQGFKTVLIERYGFCGGGAVAGLSGTVCGLYLAQRNPNIVPDQIVFGFTREFVTLLDRRGGLAEPIRYGNTYTRVHDPLVWREAADQVLTEAGVRVLYHALVTDTLLDGEAIAGVVVSARGGKITVRGSMVVDASGDAHVAAMSGLATTIGREGVVQNPTMIFRIAGVDVERFMRRYGPDTIMPSEVSALIREEDAAGRYKLPRAKIFFSPPRGPANSCAIARVSSAPTGGNSIRCASPIWRRRSWRGVGRCANTRASSATTWRAARTLGSTTPAWKSEFGKAGRSPASRP